ncbi:hypothetical protein B0T24DRAFT_707000 [Lasiosphaeria ovina]|uniref:Uncharacterized protein n=1 Tax=Lasiosphaeria ovina TaxID=92902 RepID=A0AAE0K2A7_9PEZI|nr:hypothetical protein B0T24DRAFT_707000 [Lasiosphaeria ovina]
MGAYVSAEVCAHYNKTLNCVYRNDTNPPSAGGINKGQIEPNPDVAGIGIISVFIGITSFALGLSAIDVLWTLCKFSGLKSGKSFEHKVSKSMRRCFSSISISLVCETLVMSCSDQQIFTGAAYALTLRYWEGCQITAYHYNIIANMMLLTCATHLMAVTVVRNYWRFPWMGGIRVLIMTGVFIVTGLLLSNQNSDGNNQTGSFPTGIPPLDETGSNMFLAAACFQNAFQQLTKTLGQSTASAPQAYNTFFKSTPGNHIQGWNWYIIILLWYCVAVIVDVVRFLRRDLSEDGEGASPEEYSMGTKICKGRLKTCCIPNESWKNIFRGLFAIYMVVGVSISGAAVVQTSQYLMGLRSWVKWSGWLQVGKGSEDDATSFGQLVPIFMSAAIFFNFFQTTSEMSKRYSERVYSKAGTLVHDPSSSRLHFGAPVAEKGIMSPVMPGFTTSWSLPHSPGSLQPGYPVSVGAQHGHNVPSVIYTDHSAPHRT